MYYFTSDTHFGGDDIILREKRPFKNSKIFLKKVIKLWNSQTKKDDIIYVVGDFFNYNKNDNTSWKKVVDVPKKIKGKIVIIIGNNEERIIKNEFDNNFENFKNFLVSKGFFDLKYEDYINFGNNKYYLNHFPINKKNDYINLFGHTHRATGLWKPFGLNLDCDLNYFSLYSQNDIEKMIEEKRTFWDNDKNNLIM